MGNFVDPNFIKMQQEVMRANGLKGAKNVTPDAKKDQRFLFMTLGVIAALIGVPLLIMLAVSLLGG